MVRYLLALSCVCVAQVLGVRPYFAAAQTDPSKCAKLLMEGAVSYKDTTLPLTNAKCLLTDVGRHEVLPGFMRGFQALIAFGRDHKGGPANPEAADEMHEEQLRVLQQAAASRLQEAQELRRAESERADQLTKALSESRESMAEMAEQLLNLQSDLIASRAEAAWSERQRRAASASEERGKRKRST